MFGNYFVKSICNRGKIGSSREGFAFAWMIVLVGVIGIFLSFALRYFYVEASVSQKIRAHDLLRRTIRFHQEECLNVINATIGSDCCAMGHGKGGDIDHLVYMDDKNHWHLLDERIGKVPLMFQVGGKRYIVKTDARCVPEYRSQCVVQSDSGKGGLKRDFKTAFSGACYKELQGTQLWPGGLCWDIFYDYQSYLEQLKNNANVADISALGFEGDDWRNMFAAWRGFTSKKSSGLEYIKKILVSPVLRNANLNMQFSFQATEVSSGVVYRLDSLSLIPELCIHNPYDTPLRVAALDCLWGLNLRLKVHPVGVMGSDAEILLNTRSLLGGNGDLIMQLPEMCLDPGERRWLYPGAWHADRPNVIIMQYDHADQSFALRLTPEDDYSLHASLNTRLRIELDHAVSSSQLRLVNNQTRDNYWRAERIVFEKGATSFIECDPEVASMLNYTIAFDGASRMQVNFNDAAISINPKNWRMGECAGGYAAKQSIHLSMGGFNSLGDFVYLPLIPLDVLPKYQLGSSLKIESASFGIPPLSPLSNFIQQLNLALWDGYWVCSAKLIDNGDVVEVPHAKTDSRNTLFTPAQRYWVKGGFNLNSVDAREWTFFLKEHLDEDVSMIQSLAKNLSQLNQQQGPQRTIADWILGSVLQSSIDSLHLHNSFGFLLNQAEVIARIAPYVAIRWDSLCIQSDVICADMGVFPVCRHTSVFFQRFPDAWKVIGSMSKKDSEHSGVPSRVWKLMSFTTE